MKIPPLLLDQNENPYGPSPKATLAAFRALKELSRYPRDVRSLEEKIASTLAVVPGAVISTSGSDRVIELTLRALSRSANRILVPMPSFQMYELLSSALGLNATFVPIYMEGYGGLIEEARGGDLIMLASPNSPDGRILGTNELEELAQTSSCLVIDEAYGEYARTSFAGLTSKIPNLVVIKTFSKAFALASLRVGYLVASEDVARRVRPLTGPYEVSTVGVEACKAALDDPSYYERVIALTQENRMEMRKALEGLRGIRVYPSHANYLLLQLLNGDASMTYEELKSRNILIRNCRGWRGLEGEFLRVSVGTKSEITLFLTAFKEVLGA